MIIYIIRHADPDYANNTITDFGWEEARALAVRTAGMKIDEIFTSPLGRAIDTARPTLEAKKMTYSVLDWTAESMNYMRSVNKPEDAGYTFSLKNGIENYSDFTDEERGGSQQQLAECSDAFFASYGYTREGGLYRVGDNASDKSVAVFCHGGFGSNWISYLLLRPAEYGWLDLRIGTTGVTAFEFTGKPGELKAPVLLFYNDRSHIENAGLRLNNR